MKKALITAMAITSLCFAGTVFAADPMTAPTPDTGSTVIATSSQAAPAWGAPGAPAMRGNGGNVRGGGMMGGIRPGYGGMGMMRVPVAGVRTIGVVGHIVGGITLVLVWAVLILAIVALAKWIKKQNK